MKFGPKSPKERLERIAKELEALDLPKELKGEQKKLAKNIKKIAKQ